MASTLVKVNGSKTTDDLISAMFGPVAAMMGKQLASSYVNSFNENDKNNLREHIEAVESNGASIDSDKLTTSQKKKLVDWSTSASECGSEQEPEAAAWRAVLESIIKNEDSGRMLDTVRQLSREEIYALIELSKSREMNDYVENKLIPLMIGDSGRDSIINNRLKESCDGLESAGLVKRKGFVDILQNNRLLFYRFIGLLGAAFIVLDRDIVSFVMRYARILNDVGNDDHFIMFSSIARVYVVMFLLFFSGGVCFANLQYVSGV